MCLSAPLIASKPHFYDADPSLLLGVKGLEPDKEIHDTHADFDLVNHFFHVSMSVTVRIHFGL